MFILRHVLFLMFALLFVLPACSDKESTAPDDDNTTEFRLFPAGYFSTGYREEYNMSGSSTNGETHTGTFLVLTQSNETFNGTQAVSVLSQADWIDVSTNAAFSSVIEEKYTTNANDRRRLGSENVLTTVINTATGNDVIPQTAEIGDSGTIGVYSDAFGNTEAITWELESAGSNRAALTFNTNVNDVNNNLIFSNEITYEITANGNRQSLTQSFFNPLLNITTDWTGTKL